MYQIQIWLKLKIAIQNITSSTGLMIYISIQILNKHQKLSVILYFPRYGPDRHPL